MLNTWFCQWFHSIYIDVIARRALARRGNLFLRLIATPASQARDDGSCFYVVSSLFIKSNHRTTCSILASLPRSELDTFIKTLTPGSRDS